MGKWGEERAMEYLRDSGADILESNFRCRAGEVDIIAADRGDFAFIEVKTRTRVSFGLPCEAVNSSKRKRIVKAACCYAVSRGMADAPFRFDVIEVLWTGGRTWLRHIRNAFEGGVEKD
jgi:putative endonuclease